MSERVDKGAMTFNERLDKMATTFNDHLEKVETTFSQLLERLETTLLTEFHKVGFATPHSPAQPHGSVARARR